MKDKYLKYIDKNGKERRKKIFIIDGKERIKIGKDKYVTKQTFKKNCNKMINGGGVTPIGITEYQYERWIYPSTIPLFSQEIETSSIRLGILKDFDDKLYALGDIKYNVLKDLYLNIDYNYARQQIQENKKLMFDNVIDTLFNGDVIRHYLFYYLKEINQENKNEKIQFFLDYIKAVYQHIFS